MESLPELARVVQLPDGTHVYVTPDQLPALPQPYSGPQVVHQHVHQAPPDRTVQRIALGSGVGAGAVAAGVYFGPLLVGVLTAMAANLALLALIAAVCAWGVPRLTAARSARPVRAVRGAGQSGPGREPQP
jgi:predicted lipid-binding transport protein (Tim44 family)